MKPATPPKFIRDNLAYDDIEGAKPRKPKHYKTRESVLVNYYEFIKYIANWRYSRN